MGTLIIFPVVPSLLLVGKRTGSTAAGEADLLVTNATGSTASVRQAGGKIYVRKAVNGLIALTVFYDDTAITEDYVFQLDGQGNGTVAWTAIRTATATNKISLMIAQCRGPR
jgi:hypothetical protein